MMRSVIIIILLDFFIISTNVSGRRRNSSKCSNSTVGIANKSKITTSDFHVNSTMTSTSQIIHLIDHISCYRDGMSAFLSRRYLKQLFFDSDRLKIKIDSNNDAATNCSSVDNLSDESYIIVTINYSMCDATKVMRFWDHVSFYSQLKVPVLLKSNYSNETIEHLSTSQLEIVQDLYCTFFCSSNLLSEFKVQQQNDEFQIDEIHNYDSFENITDIHNSVSKNTNFSFQLQLFDKPWTGSAWNVYPRVVYEKRTVYAQINLSQKNYDNDLRPSVQECYISPNSNPSHENRHLLISSGCPLTDSALIHSRSSTANSQINRFTFEPNHNFDKAYIFFHCKATVCSSRGNREVEGFVQCQNSTSCVDRTIKTANYALVNGFYSLLSSGPLRPIPQETPNVFSNRQVDQSLFTIVEPPAATCPPCPLKEIILRDEHLTTQRRIIVTTGLSVSTAVGIATASFAMGLALMGGLWKVHDLTEPKKCENLTMHNMECEMIPTDKTQCFEPLVQHSLNNQLTHVSSTLSTTLSV